MNSTNILFLILLISAIFGMTFNSLPGSLGTIGDVSLLLGLATGCIVILIHFIFNARLPTILAWIGLPAALLASLYLFMSTVHGGEKSFQVAIETTLILAFFLGATFYRWSKQSIRFLGLGVALYIFVTALQWLASEPQVHFAAYLSHKNMLGGVLFGMLFWVLALSLTERPGIVKMVTGIAVLVGVLLLAATNSRGSMLAFLTMAISMFALKFAAKSKILWSTYLLLTILFIAGFTVSYSVLGDYIAIDELSEMVRAHSGGNLYSGRQKIWPELITLIGQSPILGYGPGTLPKNFLGTSLSSHNFYLQLLLQAGFLGLALFLLLFWRIWMVLWKGRNSYIVRLSASYMIGILVHQTFEVSLTQNNLSIGLLQWLILAVGVSQVVHHIDTFSLVTTPSMTRMAKES